MPDQTNDGSAVQGGSAQSVYIKNATMPGGGATPAGENNIGAVDIASIPDGVDAALGARADTAAVADTGTFSLTSGTIRVNVFGTEE